ncbi:MAG: tandem-95 repeat protein, partial [Candidatus Margulisbacteria bacterium]|nr:tandem-95 repeat protein [Candidatus Margulisiibacteriota bacterium]
SNDNFIFSGQLLGSDRNNVLIGSELSDLIYAGDGDDHIEASHGHDTVSGGNGADTIYGESGHDILFGNSGNDRLYGEEGNDILDGGDGQDILVSDIGDDILIGGNDSDQFVIYENANSTTIIEDFDVTDINEKIDLSLMASILSPNDFTLVQNGSDTEIYFINNQKIVLKNIDKDNLSFENFVIQNVFHADGNFDGSNDHDVIIGSDLENIINGFLGNDYISGYKGNDWLHGGEGHDKIYGGDGDDHLYGDGSRDWDSLNVVGFDSETGNDELYGGEGDDFLFGGPGNDLLSGGTGNNSIFGNAGSDIFIITPAALHDTILSSPLDIIADFDISDQNEKIDFSLVKNVSRFSDLLFEQNGDNTYIVLPQGSIGYSQLIILQDVDASSLNESHFIGFNNAPELGDDSVQVHEDQSVTFSILENDRDDKTNLLTEANVFLDLPQNGTISFNEDGSVNYEANPNFYGSDSFTYTVIDTGGLSSSATVWITVIPINDTPTILVDSIKSFGDNPIRLDVLSQSTDIDGDVLSIQSVTNGQNGSTIIENGQIIYTPGDEFSGSDQFEVIISDTQGGLSSKIIQISPMSIKEDTSAEFDLSSTFPDSSYQIESVNTPDHGNVSIVEGKVIYAPDTNYFGVDSFEYILINSEGNLITKTVSFTVEPINDAPRLNPNFSFPPIIAGQAFGFSLQTLFIDADGDSLDFQVTLTNSTPLPPWLTYNQETGIIQGTAPLDLSQVELTLTASDSFGATLSENITLQILDQVITGTDEDDLLIGTELSEKIDGKNGADTLKGEDGHDWIEGGLGDDILRGG